MSGPASIPLSMLILFVSAKLMAEVAERLNQPGIVGEILAGVLIGPSVSWLAGTKRVSFRHVGSRRDVSALSRRTRSQVVRTDERSAERPCWWRASGVIVPFIMGAAILLLWGAKSNEAIFVGASMVATSVGITAQVLSAKGLLHEVSSKVILAAAVIDDVLGLLVLAVVSSLTHGKFDFFSFH